MGNPTLLDPLAGMAGLRLLPDDRPNILRLERALLANQATLVPGCFRKAHMGRDRSVHDRLLDPDHTAQRAPTTAASQVAEGGFSLTFRTIALAAPPVAKRRFRTFTRRHGNGELRR